MAEISRTAVPAPRRLSTASAISGGRGWLAIPMKYSSRPNPLQEFAKQLTGLQPVLTVVEEMAAATREALGAARLAWLRELPCVQTHGPMTLVHASPESAWRALSLDASDVELESVFGPLDKPISIYGHIHRSFVRSVPRRIVANTGSVSLSYDGDRRAAYLLLDEGNHPSGV